MRYNVSLGLTISVSILVCSSLVRAQELDDLFLRTSVKGDIQSAKEGDLWATLRAGYRFMDGEAGMINYRLAGSYFTPVASKSPVASALLAYTRLTVYGDEYPNMRKLEYQRLQVGAEDNEPVAETLLGRISSSASVVCRRTPILQKICTPERRHVLRLQKRI